MIYEYAVDPDLVASWGDLRDYRYFSKEFGIGTPRIVAAFPNRKKWRKNILKLAQILPALHRDRVIEIVRIMSERMTNRNQVNYDENTSWENNAVIENKKLPFEAIFTLNNHENYHFIITPSTIDNSYIWDVERGVIIERNSVEMAGIICPMLQKANNIIFVDPYFAPHEDRYFKSFKPGLCSNNRCKNI